MSKHLPPRIRDLYCGRYDVLIEYINKSEIFSADQEMTLLITLDAGCFEINHHLMAIGGMDDCKTDIRLLLNRIALDKASKFVLAHNHPSGVAAFSKEDIRFTISLLFLSEIVGVEFLDHLLFAYGREPISFQREHPAIFQRCWLEVYDTMIKKYLPRKP